MSLPHSVRHSRYSSLRAAMQHELHRKGVCVYAASLLGLAAAPSMAMGPGIGNITFQESEVFKTIGELSAPKGTNYGNGTLHNGYWVAGIDVSDGNGGLQAWDLSNPRKPVLVHQRYDAETKRLRELHTFSFVKGYGLDLFTADSHEGIHIWDWTDIKNPKPYSAVKLASGGATSYNGVVSTFWQPPYIYAGGNSDGLFVVDARDPKNPKMVKRLPTGVLAGEKIGGTFAIGNLLVVTSMGGKNSAVSTFDISDPANPELLHTYKHSGATYTMIASGDRVYSHGIGGQLIVYDYSDPNRIREVGRSKGNDGRGGYGMYQDGFVHAGMSNSYVKYDVRGNTPVQVGKARVGLSDHDWTCVMGNLLFLGDDDRNQAKIVPHQTGPDLLGPAVNLISPTNGAVKQALTSRVGISFTDAVDLNSVDTRSFMVRPVGGKALEGKYSGQMGIINFGPDKPLLPNTTYEVVLAKGGVKDWVGNPIEKDFVARFSTGPSLDNTPTALLATQPRQAGNSPSFGAFMAGPARHLPADWALLRDATGRGQASASHRNLPAAGVYHISPVR